MSFKLVISFTFITLKSLIFNWNDDRSWLAYELTSNDSTVLDPDSHVVANVGGHLSQSYNQACIQVTFLFIQKGIQWCCQPWAPDVTQMRWLFHCLASRRVFSYLTTVQLLCKLSFKAWEGSITRLWPEICFYRFQFRMAMLTIRYGNAHHSENPQNYSQLWQHLGEALFDNIHTV